MRTSAAVDFYHASSMDAHLLEVRTNECNHNGHRSFLPVPNLPSQPMSVLSGWGRVRSKVSEVPSSLKAWLTSKKAVAIG
jgi:hypothetical protein